VHGASRFSRLLALALLHVETGESGARFVSLGIGSDGRGEKSVSAIGPAGPGLVEGAESNQENSPPMGEATALRKV